jgi:hypothetical protein
MFTDAYINSKIHFLVCGRAGYEYETGENEDTGKKEMSKSGTKMKAEGEFGFEPSLLIEMIKVPNSELTKNKKAKGHINRAIVLKDRSDLINGKMIDKPKFKDFLPHINYLNIGGEHFVMDPEKSSKDMFADKDWSYEDRKRQREILIETLHDDLVKFGLAGRSDKDQKKRIELMEMIFGNSSKTFIENLPLRELQAGIQQIKEMFETPPLAVKETLDEIAKAGIDEAI